MDLHANINRLEHEFPFLEEANSLIAEAMSHGWIMLGAETDRWVVGDGQPPPMGPAGGGGMARVQVAEIEVISSVSNV